MKQLILICFLLTSTWAQNSVEQRVLQAVQRMVKETGKVTFSTLYNDPNFSKEEKEFLGRLYETGFAIPTYLRNRYDSSGAIPSTDQIADNFGISRQSVLLLLSVLESDSRVPDLFERNSQTGEISSLNLDLIEKFLQRKGGEVRIRKWEGMSLPDFQLSTLGGEVLTKKHLLGRNSLVYFWFTGCPPCVKIAPILADLSGKYSSSEISFYGFNADDLLEIGTSNDSRQSYIHKQGIRFVNANLDDTVREAFGNVNVYPTIFLVDEQGIIEHHLVNFQTRETLVEAIEQMME